MTAKEDSSCGSAQCWASLGLFLQRVGIKTGFSLKAAVTTGSIRQKQAFENSNLWSIDTSAVSACIFCRQRNYFSLTTVEWQLNCIGLIWTSECGRRAYAVCTVRSLFLDWVVVRFIVWVVLLWGAWVFLWSNTGRRLQWQHCRRRKTESILYRCCVLDMSSPHSIRSIRKL